MEQLTRPCLPLRVAQGQNDTGILPLRVAQGQNDTEILPLRVAQGQNDTEIPADGLSLQRGRSPILPSGQ